MQFRTGSLILMIGLVAVSGSVKGDEIRLKSNVDPDTIEHSAYHAERVSQFIMAYASCLTEAWNKTSVSRLNQGKLPSLEAKIYEDQCIPQERDLYIAFYSGAFKGNPNAEKSKKHATGRKGVLTVKKTTFDAIYEDFTDIE